MLILRIPFLYFMLPTKPRELNCICTQTRKRVPRLPKIFKYTLITLMYSLSKNLPVMVQQLSVVLIVFNKKCFWEKEEKESKRRDFYCLPFSVNRHSAKATHTIAKTVAFAKLLKKPQKSTPSQRHKAKRGSSFISS